jgi:hypothetical protein
VKKNVTFNQLNSNHYSTRFLFNQVFFEFWAPNLKWEKKIWNQLCNDFKKNMSARHDGRSSNVGW